MKNILKDFIKCKQEVLKTSATSATDPATDTTTADATATTSTTTTTTTTTTLSPASKQTTYVYNIIYITNRF